MVGTTQEYLEKLIKRVEGKSLNGKPFIREHHYGIRQVIDERTGEAKLIYRPHPMVLKDMDPEDGEPWPYDIFSFNIVQYLCDEPFINRPLQLKIQVEYSFTSPTETFIGVEHEGRWITYMWRSMVGEGVKEFTLEVPVLKKYGETVFHLKAFHKEHDWIEDSSIEVKLDFMKVKCDECSRLLSFDGSSPEVRCSCGKAWYRVENRTVYTLKHNEAFCYDFNSDWVYYWKLSCPNCGTIVDLEFNSGRWLCTQCGYVEPKHEFRFFRCVLPCGHEHTYSIHYLIDDLLLKCWTCSREVELPRNIRLAWKGLNFMLLDIPAKIAVQGEYLIRRNPLIVSAIELMRLARVLGGVGEK
jgi:ribosomal protein S27AE/ribosomal protein S27E